MDMYVTVTMFNVMQDGDESRIWMWFLKCTLSYLVSNRLHHFRVSLPRFCPSKPFFNYSLTTCRLPLIFWRSPAAPLPTGIKSFGILPLVLDIHPSSLTLSSLFPMNAGSAAMFHVTSVFNRYQAFLLTLSFIFSSEHSFIPLLCRQLLAVSA